MQIELEPVLVPTPTARVATVTDVLVIGERIDVAQETQKNSSIPTRLPGGVMRCERFTVRLIWTAATFAEGEARLGDLVAEACRRSPAQAVAIRRWARRLPERLGLREIPGHEKLDQYVIARETFDAENAKRERHTGPGKSVSLPSSRMTH